MTLNPFHGTGRSFNAPWKHQATSGYIKKPVPWNGKKEGGSVFEGGWYPNVHYDNSYCYYSHI